MSNVDKEGSILLVILKKGSILAGHIFLKRGLKSLSHVQKKVQFFESCIKKGSIL